MFVFVMGVTLFYQLAKVHLDEHCYVLFINLR